MLARSVLPVCLCLLTLAFVVGIAMARDPSGFSLKEWQTITASFVALGAATLAYSAAMAKVHFDERTAQEDERRKTLGIFLRFDFAVDVLKYEAETHIEKIDPPTSPSENSSVVADDLALSEMPEIKEAWENLDYFPVELSQAFYSVQNELYNFAQFKKDHAGENYPSEFGMTEHEDLSDLRDILRDLHQNCTNALGVVRSETAKLRGPAI
ncbi:MAG: hypothetical protein QOD95_2916 [Gammaproteobacteria bacterium]|jgi:hypothetical protein|nr:hypothetical protein [Gammaproteobacteria bacterium]